MLGLKGDKLIIYLLENVEDELSQANKDKKKKAFAGDANAQYQIGMHYWDEGYIKNDSAIISVGIRFLAEAAKRGHTDARAKFNSDGKDWRDYTS